MDPVEHGSGDAANILDDSKEKSRPITKADVSSESLLICPVLVDDFYMNREGKITVGRDHHCYLQEKLIRGSFNLDLNQGYETYDELPRDEGLGQIEQYLTFKADRMDSNKLKAVTENADVVMRRGGITKLASSLCDFRKGGWKFRVEKFQDVFFLSEIVTDARAEWKENATDFCKRGNYWGHKFAAVMLAKKGQEEAKNKPVTPWEDIHALFALTIPECATERCVKLFFTSVMDGLDAEGNYVELKTQAYRLFNNEYFSDKAMKWWIQSKLVGVDDIIVGLRTNKGKLFQVDKVDLRYLDRMCPFWDGELCFRAAQHILNEIRQNYDEMVKPGELMVVEKKGNEEFFKFTVEAASEGTVLTPEFKSRFEN